MLVQFAAVDEEFVELRSTGQPRGCHELGEGGCPHLITYRKEWHYRGFARFRDKSVTKP